MLITIAQTGNLVEKGVQTQLVELVGDHDQLGFVSQFTGHLSVGPVLVLRHQDVARIQLRITVCRSKGGYIFYAGASIAGVSCRLLLLS